MYANQAHPKDLTRKQSPVKENVIFHSHEGIDTVNAAAECLPFTEANTAG